MDWYWEAVVRTFTCRLIFDLITQLNCKANLNNSVKKITITINQMALRHDSLCYSSLLSLSGLARLRKNVSVEVSTRYLKREQPQPESGSRKRYGNACCTGSQCTMWTICRLKHRHSWVWMGSVKWLRDQVKRRLQRPLFTEAFTRPAQTPCVRSTCIRHIAQL